MTAINTTIKVVTKPWGRELWLYVGPEYVVKRIELNAGEPTSLQYHRKKHETNCIIAGSAVLEIQNEAGPLEEYPLQKHTLQAGDLYVVPPPLLHRLTAVTDVVMIETSTTHVDDVVRVEDKTGRGDGRIGSEHAEGK